jgi:hypothetical protein
MNGNPGAWLYLSSKYSVHNSHGENYYCRMGETSKEAEGVAQHVRWSQAPVLALSLRGNLGDWRRWEVRGGEG